MSVDPRAVLSGPVGKHSNIPPDVVSKEALLGQFFSCVLLCLFACFLLSVLGVLGRVFLAVFSRGRSFSGLDLLASCQGPRSDPYMGEENTS